MTMKTMMSAIAIVPNVKTAIVLTVRTLIVMTQIAITVKTPHAPLICGG
jgi:hypothetical protein